MIDEHVTCVRIGLNCVPAKMRKKAQVKYIRVPKVQLRILLLEELAMRRYPWVGGEGRERWRRKVQKYRYLHGDDQ